MTKPLSFNRYRFPPDVIRHAIWLYFRFTLSLRDVEEMVAQRGLEVSSETIRCWVNHFGPLIAANIRRRRGPPTSRWRLDEAVIRIKGKRLWLWRAVDDEGEVLDVLVQKRRNTAPAACARTTGRRTVTSRSDGGNESRNGSNPRVPHRDFCRPTALSTTASTLSPT